MKQAIAKSIIQSCINRGYVMHNDRLYTPAEANLLGINNLVKKNRKKKETGKKTGWIDDYRNIRNKENYRDAFRTYLEMFLHVEVWPEFFFSYERSFRIDYSIPVYNNLPVKIAIEQEGGIWMKGNSGHSSGKGITRDMEKSNLLMAGGWTLIRRTPDQMQTEKTLQLIESFLIKNNR